MKRVVFKKLVTLTGDEYDRGEVIIDQGRIVEILSSVSEEFDGETLDWSDCLILPGFVNAHAHLSLSGLKGKIHRQDRFVDWIESVVAENAALSWPDRVTAMHREAQSLIASGVTALGDYVSHPELLVEFSQLPFRHVLFIETLGFRKSETEEKIKMLEALLQEHPGKSEVLQLGLAPHAPYSVAPELFQGIHLLAERYGCRVSCHIAEVAEEKTFLDNGGGDFLGFLKQREVYDAGWKAPHKSPVAYLDDLGVLQNMVAIHLNYLDDIDIELLARRQVSAVFCAGSTHWFGRKQWMPIRTLLDKGLAVGLGTDSLASNETLNFLNEIRKSEEMSPELHRSEILWLASVGGAQALNIGNNGLVSGGDADMIGFRFSNAEEDWWDIPFSKNRQTVDFSMISGEQIFPSPAAIP